MKKITIILLLLMILTSTAYADPNGPYRDKYIEGYLIDISQNKATIEEYDGTVHSLSILRNAYLTIDGIPVKYSDFRLGMEVFGTLQGRSLRTLESYSTENPGYIPPGKKVRAGIIKNLNPNYITIRIPSGEDEIYTITPATIITRKGNPTSLSKLYEGDSVRLYFDEYNTSSVSRIEVEGDSILVEGIYKGIISFNDSLDDRIILKDVKKLNNIQWKDYSELVALEGADDLPIYIGGQRINPTNLKYYKGREAYIAVKSIFGRKTIEKIVIKANRELNFTEKIIDINYYSDSFKLNNMINLTLNDGTIIVKNNRLVDKYSVNSQSDAFVVADSAMNPQANLIYIYSEDINNSNIGTNALYFGRLDEIVDYSVLLDDYSVLDRNEWNSYRRETELFYDDDTHIYNLDDKKLITVEEFQAGNYAVDEDSDYADDNNLKDFYGYIYTDGNNILAAGLQQEEDDLFKQRITLGYIKELSTDPYVGSVMTITDARDYSSRKETFIHKTQDLRLMLEDALIVKEDKLLSKEDLKPGDRLYIVRDDFRCKFILVK